MKILCLACIFTLALVIFISAWNDYVFTRDCGGYISLAGHAGSLRMAETNLSVAIAYIESRNLTAGNTSCFFPSPKNDLSIWYRSLVDIRDLVREEIGKDNNNLLEATNVLMKVKDVTSRPVPEEIGVFPSQTALATCFIVAFVLGFVLFAISENDR